MSADLDRLLPHRPPMRLLDRVVSSDAETCVAEWTVPVDSPWVEDGRLVRAALVEVAAQTAAAHAGLAAGDTAPPRVGFLGGVTGFRVLSDARAGDVLSCQVRLVAGFGALARFDCRIERGSTLVAAGSIAVARPLA